MALFSGCGGDDGQTGADAGAPDAGGGPAACAEPALVDTVFDVGPATPLTQIHGSAVAAEGGLIIAMNLVSGDGTGNFDVFMTKVRCDGQVAVPAFQVNTIGSRNHIDPTLAVSSDGVLVAWQSDDQVSEANLDLLYRIFEPDLNPRMAADGTLETLYEGAPATGNAWMPSVAGHGDGFVIAGARGLEVTNRFQAFVQAIDRDGALDGVAYGPPAEADASQVTPTLVVRQDGNFGFGWDRRADNDALNVMSATFAVGSGLTPMAGAPAFAGDEVDQIVVAAASGSAAAAEFRAAHVVAGSEHSIAVRAVVDGVAGEPVVLGASGRVDHTPNLAAGASGGMVVWHRVITGFRTEVVVQPFAIDGTTITPGDERIIVGDGPGAPYQPAIVHLGDDHYFVAWSEGQASTDWRLRGIIIKA